jgi:hypothetical protein
MKNKPKVKIKFKNWWDYLSWKNWRSKKMMEEIVNQFLNRNENFINDVLLDSMIFGTASYYYDEKENAYHVSRRDGSKNNKDELGEK